MDFQGYPKPSTAAIQPREIVFVIDQSGIVRHQVVNDEPLGRNMDEVIRIVEALQFFEANGQVCPAGWTKEKDAFTPNADGIAAYLKDNVGDL